jgi:hypothetical protein
VSPPELMKTSELCEIKLKKKISVGLKNAGLEMAVLNISIMKETWWWRRILRIRTMMKLESRMLMLID